MTDDEGGPLLLNLDQFKSRDDALNAVQRHNGFDDAVRPVLTEIVQNAAWMNIPIAFFLSAVSRARAIHEGITREIENDNPQAAFSLMRQFAETVAVVYYTADTPEYIDTVVRDDKELEPTMAKRKSLRSLARYMDGHYSTQFGAVYGELCSITHFGALAVWNAHRPEGDGEVMTTTWTSAPRWRRDEDLFIACGQLLELSNAMETGLRKLGRTCLDIVSNASAV